MQKLFVASPNAASFGGTVTWGGIGQRTVPFRQMAGSGLGVGAGVGTDSVPRAGLVNLDVGATSVGACILGPPETQAALESAAMANVTMRQLLTGSRTLIT